MADLAAALDVAPSTAGRMCDRLVRKGLIRRHRARADRRAVLVSVTAAGRRVVDQATARRRALIAEILGTLPEGAAGGRGGAAGVLGRGRGGTRQPVATAAPGFTLSDQDGQVLPLSAFRGKVVVLEFMDPHCTDICPIVSAEFTDAYRDLGRQASQVVFAAGNVNQYHHAVADVTAYSRAHQLTSIPSWHFFTGPVPRLRAVWNAYNIAVQAPGPDANIVHSSAVYFIDPGGPGAVPRLPAGRPHHVRGLLPARGPDRRLGTGHRAGRGTPRGLTSRAARQCSDMHRREPPLVTVRRYTGPVTATGHVIDILL